MNDVARHKSWFAVAATVSLLSLTAGMLSAQEASIEHGTRLYQMNCATAYCHGPAGTAGRAPKLQGHNHSINSMFKVISWGIPGTGMPEFTSRLSTEEIAALVAYMMTLRGTPSATVAAAPIRPLTPETTPGRALFFDAARAGACGTCHEVDGWGVPVGPDLLKLPPERFADLRRVSAPRVITVRPADGETPFPALVAEQSETRIRLYDLTALLPVLRSFPAAGVSLTPGSSWRHDQTARRYNDRELEAIGRYLRWLTEP